MRSPSCAPRPVPTSSAVGVARPERARAGDDQHGDGRGEGGSVQPAPAATQNPSVASGEDDDDRDEDAGHPVGQPLHVGLAVLRVLDEPGHLRQLGVGTDPGGPHHEPAAGVDGRADHAVARRPTSTGTDSPVSIDASTADVPSTRRCRRSRPSRPAAPRTRRPPPAGRRGSAPRDAVAAQDRHVLGAELQQRAQGGAGAALGARLGIAAGQQERR